MHLKMFRQKLSVFGCERAEVTLEHGVENDSVNRAHVSVQVAVLSKLLLALVTVQPETLVH